MNKIKIQDLEVGKIYRAFYRGEKASGIYKIESNGRLFENCGTAWEESRIIYNEMFNVTFEEIKREINWTKVPRGTKVQVKSNKHSEWENRYFVTYDFSLINPFEVTDCLDDDFTGCKMEDYTWNYKYCRIHESVEIPNEWYKEVE